MRELYKQIIHINRMPDDSEKQARVKAFFDSLNSMTMPDSFNWASQVFEGIHVARTPDKTALVYEDLTTLESSRFSYFDLSCRANRLINFLANRGVGIKDNMYMMVPLCPEIWFASLACIKAGIVSVPTATTMTARELEFRFGTYKPDVILADMANVDIIENAIRETGIVPKVKLVLGKAPGWISYDEVESESDTADAVDTASDDILFCFFTSGTTGLPKRVGHTAVSYPVGHLSTTVMLGLTPDDTHHNLSAPGWGKWAWSSFFAPFNVGATVTAFRFDSLDAKTYLDAVAKQKVTTLCAPPTAWRMFVNADLDGIDLRCLRQSVSAGEPLNPEVITRWHGFTATRIRDFYGQTESTAMIGNPPWMAENMRAGSFGMPSSMYDVALADDDGNEITQPDQVGHIVVKINKWMPVGLFKEYIGNPEKMDAVFVDPYYYTGDRASFDADGYWWFVGRADDVIKSSDYRIGPFEVESALIEHPAVDEAAVVGTPDPNRYQLVKAYVILSPGETGNRELALALFRHTMNILAKFKIPRIIEFVDKVPKTISGKIRRIDLRDAEADRRGSEGVEKAPVKEYFYWDFPELSAKNK
ncbi:acyl-CoA synthetase [Desulfobacter curvatus]|uniref:acyl-CoA synthetase n=1 Tax=Desulfobacter curvatus TaxID=2290 RepID=UPI00036749C8|nr:AMP-binding protein [Desulfobacter curvatus]